MAAGEILLLACSVVSLLLSCILWSSHKQVWMDEIFTWKEVSDRSLWHLYWAIQHGADGGQPLFYTTAWLWEKVFGSGILTLRLYSSVAMCAALVVVWTTLRRFYGLWATAFGALLFWGTSNTLLDQNVEARFYGLYLLTVAITIALYARLIDGYQSSRFILLAAFFSQAALVLTHVLGLVYSGLMLLALLLVDAARRRLRITLYVAYAAGWLTLGLWLPAIRASMAAGKPHGWIAMPTLTDLRTAYLFADSLQWMRLFKRHSMEAGFQVVSRSAELVIYGSLICVFILALRRVAKSGWRAIAQPRGALLLLAYILLTAPGDVFFAFPSGDPGFCSPVLPAQRNRVGDRVDGLRRLVGRRSTRVSPLVVDGAGVPAGDLASDYNLCRGTNGPELGLSGHTASGKKFAAWSSTGRGMAGGLCEVHAAVLSSGRPLLFSA